MLMTVATELVTMSFIKEEGFMLNPKSNIYLILEILHFGLLISSLVIVPLSILRYESKQNLSAATSDDQLVE